MDIIEEFKNQSIQRFKSVKRVYPYHIRLMISKSHILFKKHYDDFDDGYQEGITSKKEWYIFLDKLKKRYNQAYENMEKYLKKQKEPVYLHSSSKKLTTFEEGRDDFYFNNVYTFNPKGMWFSCDDQWFKWFKEHTHLNLDNDKIINIDLRFAPFNIYRLYIDNLRVKNINNCEELREFSDHYKDKSANRNFMLSLSKIKKDYDVIVMCDYLAIRCSDYLKKQKIIKYNNFLKDVFLSKVKNKDKKILWTYRWETGTGVVINDFNKIVYKKMKF